MLSASPPFLPSRSSLAVQLHRNFSTIRRSFAWIGLRIRDFPTSYFKNINRFTVFSNAWVKYEIVIYRTCSIPKKLWWFRPFILKNIYVLYRKQPALILAQIQLKSIQVQDRKNYCKSYMLKNHAHIVSSCIGHMSYAMDDF